MHVLGHPALNAKSSGHKKFGPTYWKVGGGGGCARYSMLYGEAPPKRGAFLKLTVCRNFVTAISSSAGW